MIRAGRGLLYVLLIIVLIIIMIGAAIFLFNRWLINTRESLIHAIEYVKSDYEFAGITITSNDGKKIFFDLAIIDQKGHYSSETNMSITGSDIFLDSRIIVIDVNGTNKAFVFPEKIYSDSIPPIKGDDIESLYVKNGTPLNYGNDLSPVYNFATGREKALVNLKVLLNMDVSIHGPGAGGFITGKSYICKVHPGGGVEIEEEK